MPEVIGDHALYFDPNNVIELANHLDAVAENQRLDQSNPNSKQVSEWLAKRYSWQNFVDTIISLMQL